MTKQVEKHKIDGSTLYNMNETGLLTIINKLPKILSVKGKKQLGIISSEERGQLTTVICCCNAAGAFIPPFIIFARKKMQPKLLDDFSLETQGTCSPSVG